MSIMGRQVDDPLEREIERMKKFRSQAKLAATFGINVAPFDFRGRGDAGDGEASSSFGTICDAPFEAGLGQALSESGNSRIKTVAERISETGIDGSPAGQSSVTALRAAGGGSKYEPAEPSPEIMKMVERHLGERDAKFSAFFGPRSSGRPSKSGARSPGLYIRRPGEVDFKAFRPNARHV